MSLDQEATITECADVIIEGVARAADEMCQLGNGTWSDHADGVSDVLAPRRSQGQQLFERSYAIRNGH
jgi:hypothetical protein